MLSAPRSTRIVVYEMLLAGHDMSEPYLASQLRKFQKTNREGLRKKLNLTRSGYFLGVVDRCNVLKEAKYISIYLFEAGHKLEQSHSHGIRHPDGEYGVFGSCQSTRAQAFNGKIVLDILRLRNAIEVDKEAKLQEHDSRRADTVNHRKALSSNRQCPRIHPKISTRSFGVVSKLSPGSRGLHANQPCAQRLQMLHRADSDRIYDDRASACGAQAPPSRHVPVQPQTETLFPASGSDTETDYQDVDSDEFEAIDRESVYDTAAEDIVPTVAPPRINTTRPTRPLPDEGGSDEELDEEYEGGPASLFGLLTRVECAVGAFGQEGDADVCTSKEEEEPEVVVHDELVGVDAFCGLCRGIDGD
ncbi:hypothetical protein R3P38DRAFT_3239971 [Favolaschia claudopus]|uniref:Uncharacterized protein n=1 Tax=Favolaschia claudopus TaxID=2862362 RepID=A0AAV9Z7M5_9AGAR